VYLLAGAPSSSMTTVPSRSQDVFRKKERGDGGRGGRGGGGGGQKGE
jgi:hypothetical protein